MDKNDWYFAVSTVLGILALLGLDWRLVAGRVAMHSSRRRQIFLLVAVMGSLAMSGIGWYVGYQIKKYRDLPINQMEIVYGRTFSSEKVELDGKRFQNCRFRSVTLVYHGTSGYGLENNQFDGDLHFETDDKGAAGLLYFLKVAGWIKPDIPVTATETPNSPVPLKVN